MTKQALSTPLSEILHGLDTLQGALDKMYRGADRRVELEMALIKLCSPELDDSNAALIRRIEALERGNPRLAASKAKQTEPIVQSPEEPKQEGQPSVVPLPGRASPQKRGSCFTSPYKAIGCGQPPEAS